jgi:hypothetical protein
MPDHWSEGRVQNKHQEEKVLEAEDCGYMHDVVASAIVASMNVIQKIMDICTLYQ